ncbi:FIP1[III]-like protein [Malania oleifera]|uniref:FIP1[III]-like protein n=1 Tax=Malania oleifera TaxID=397392 RepID=UPI0025AE7575|nr:FIP1[III]-like protein [Malania oleifera]
MEDIGDDFGDIYADVEAQAASAVNGVADFTRLYIEREDDDGNNDTNNNSSDSGNDSVAKRACSAEGLGLKNVKSTRDEPVWSDDDGPSQNKKASSLEVDGSDSEDDLNIVLNDEDCGMFSINGGASVRSGGSDEEDGDGGLVVGLEQANASHSGERGNGLKGTYHHSQYKYIRHHAAACSNVAKASGTAGLASSSPLFARIDWEDNRCNQQKGLGSGHGAHLSSKAVPGLAQSGYGFSLPWYRTILDVDINSFEQKPWRNPGVDITDFFNFGFDEESWKSYCNYLEQTRQQTTLRTRIPVHESSKTTQAYKAGFENEKIHREAVAGEIAHVRQAAPPGSKYDDKEVRQLRLPKGRAIQVEGSSCERLPSMDVRRPRNRDSDVVIQIAVQDTMENSCGSQKGEGGHRDGTVHESSEYEDFDMDDDMDIQRFGSANAKGPSAESPDRNVDRLDWAVLKRCSQSAAASNIVAEESGNCGNDQIFDAECRHCQNKNLHTSDGNAEVVETLNSMKEEVARATCNTNSCIMETESSLGDEIQQSPCSSNLGSQSDASEHCVHADPEDTRNSIERPSSNSVIDLQDSVSSDYYLTKDFKSKGVHMKTGDYVDSLRYKKFSQEERESRSRRLHRLAELKFNTNNYDDSPISDMEGLYDDNRHLSSVGGRRRKEALRDLGSYDREDISNHWEVESGPHSCCQRFSDNHVQSAYTKKNRRKGHLNFRDETGQYFGRRWDESEYFLEERITRVDKRIMEGDWYHHERGTANEDMDHHTYQESRQVISKQCSYTDRERGTRWRKKSDYHQFRKRSSNDDRLFECKHADDFVQEKYGKSYIEKERDLIDEKYGRHLAFAERENFGRRERCGSISSLDLDDSIFLEFGDEYWRHSDYQSMSSRSFREPHSASGARWHDISPRNDLYDTRLPERYGRRRRHICAERCRDSGCFGSHNDSYENEDGIIYPDDQVHFGKRRYDFQSKVLHWSEDQLICRHQDDELFAEEEPFYYERISRHERIHGKHESTYDGMLTADRQFDRHRCKMTSEGRSRNCSNRSSNIVRRGKLEQTVLRCRSSVDLVVGEGKSSGRCFKPESVMCCGKLQKVESKNDREQAIKDFDKSRTGTTAEPSITEIGNDQNGEKWLDKFTVSEHNDALDIEEGQIVPEGPDRVVHILKESDTGFLFEKKCCFETASQTSSVKKNMMHSESAGNADKVVRGIDNRRILDVLAKMEKRRERFKDPIAAKKVPDKGSMPQVDPVVEPAENKQQRPARKRRWGGS